MWAKYNVDEIYAGVRGMGVGITTAGVISMLFEQEHLLSLAAIVFGILVLILASRKRSPS